MIEEPITQLLADIAIALRRGPNIDGEHPIHTTAEDLAAVLDAAEALAASIEVQPIYHGMGVEVALARWRELGGGR